MDRSSRRKYRIQVVAELTGVPAATLRAWERRYGFPIPSRTESAYRIYTEADVEMIRRLKELCDQGMSPAEAVKLVTADRPLLHAAAGAANSDDPFLVLRNDIVDAVSRYDPDALEEVLYHVLVVGSASIIYDRILRPVMIEIGDKWHAGELTVGQEHLASQLVELTVRRLLVLVQPHPDQSADRRLVLACFADEEHTLPLYGLALHLASAGFRPVVLGGRTPPSAIAQSVRELKPACVGLSVSVSPTPAAHARELVEAYAAACGDTPWVVGGRAAPSLRALVTARGGVVSQDDDPGALIREFERMARARSTGAVP